MLKFLFSTLFISTTAFASGGGGHDVSVMDLIPPAINFFLLLGFLIYKIKGPLSNYFTEKANLVEETVERANIKAKEAKIKMENQQNKMNNLKSTTGEIFTNADGDLKTFKVVYDKEIVAKIEKLQKDAVSKIEAEKKGLYEELNKEIIDEVLGKAKSLVKADQEVKNKINSNVIKGL